MEDYKQEMSREELVTQLNSIIEEKAKLKVAYEAQHEQMKQNEQEFNAYKEKMNYRIAEMQKHIDCLQEELEQPAETEENIIHCGSAITVAQDLIEMSMPNIDLFGHDHKSYYYSKSELKQIAEHLMVYVSNVEDRD